MKKTLFISILLLVAFFNLEAQENEIPFVQLNGNLQLGIPVEAFKNNLSTPGFGFGGLLAIRLGDTPLFPGLEASGISYDREFTEFNLWVDGNLTDVRLETSNNIFLIHGLVRIMPNIDLPVQPYIDGMIGTKLLYTRTKLVDLLIGEDEVLESDTDQSDWAFSYGGAAGVQINLSRTRSILLDLRCAYLPGASAKYLVRRTDSGPINDPIDAFEEKSSPTALLLPQIGVTFEFTKFSD